MQQESYSARNFRVPGQFQTDPSGNMVKTFSYAGESTAVTLKIGLPRVASDASSVIMNGFAFNYIVRTGGALTSAVPSLTRIVTINNATETSTSITLTAPTPAYNLSAGTTVNRPYSAVTTPTADSETSTTTITYLITITIVATNTCSLEIVGADVFFTPATSAASTTVGNLTYGNVETPPNILKANGQIVSQATYPALFAKVGITPQFTTAVKTVLPLNLIDIAYGDVGGTGTYVAISQTRVWISTDAVMWNAIPAAQYLWTNSLSSIIYFPATSTFIMTGVATTVLYSSIDGINWNIVYGPDTGITYLACSGAAIIAINAQGQSSDNGIGYVYRSTNGTTWTKTAVAVSATYSAISYCPAFGGGTAVFVLGTNSGGIQTSPDGTTWTSRTSNVASQINAIANGNVGANGTIVAVGGAGVITVSSDSGATWTAATYQTGVALTGVAYSPTNNNWVACGLSIIMTSTNGTTWNTHMATIGGNNSLFFGNGLYITCGNNCLLATSPDLITWTARTSAVPNVTFNAGAYGASTYVIVGNNSTTGRIQSSPDGITWTNRTSNAGANNINHVIFAAGAINLFVAIAAGGVIVTSPDGATWTAQVSNLTAVNGTALAFDGTTIVAVAASGKISSSTNGTTWTARTSNTTLGLTGVAHNGTIFCAVGSVSDVITSPDGITWTKQTPIFPNAFLSLQWVTSDGTSFYASVGNVLYISTDAITWSPYPLWNTTISVNFTNSLLIATTTAGSFTTSTNGITWSQPSSPRGANATWNRVYWFSAHSRYLLSVSSIGGIYSSTDGLSFNGFTTSNLNDIYDITYSVSQNRIVAVGVVGIILNSTDNGVTFSPVYSLTSGSSTNHTLQSCAYSPSLNLFVVGTNRGTVFTSPNGTTWTQRIFSDPYNNASLINFASIIWVASKNLFVACGRIAIITSSDGITWTSRVSGLSCTQSVGFRSVAYNTTLDRFIVSGVDLPIYTSTNGTTWTAISNPAGGIGIINAIVVVNLEANGFHLVGSIASNQLYSADGLNWRSIVSNANGTSGSIVSQSFPTKALYSSVDSCALYPSGTTGYLIKTVDQNQSTMDNSLTSFGNIMFCLCYILAVDKYIVAGQDSTICILSRTYDKSTHFALPNLPGLLIHMS